MSSGADRASPVSYEIPFSGPQMELMHGEGVNNPTFETQLTFHLLGNMEMTIDAHPLLYTGHIMVGFHY